MPKGKSKPKYVTQKQFATAEIGVPIIMFLAGIFVRRLIR